MTKCSQFSLCFFVFIFFCASVNAQNISQEPSHVAVSKTYLIRPFFDIPAYSFYLGAPDIKGHALVPNFSPRLGLSFGTTRTQLSFSYSLPIPQDEVDRRGSSSQQAYLLHSEVLSHPMDLYFQKYRGFYAGNPLSELSLAKPTRFTQFPSASVENVGANIYFVQNPESYTPRAAMDQVRIVKKDGSSSFFMPFINRLRMDMGSAIVAGTDSNDLQTFPEIHTADLTTLGVSWGYGESKIVGQKPFVFSWQTALGPAVQYQNVQTENSQGGYWWNVAGKWTLRLNYSYNSDDVTYGARVFADTQYSRIGSSDLYSTVISFQAFYGMRF